MPQLVSVRFRFNPKALWFDPQDTTYTAGTEVLVETERGREVGTIVNPDIQATEKQISKLKSPLKPVIRELTELDHEHVQALDEKGKSAMPYFREKVEEYELDIKPVEVQYLFSGERAIFFFSSEERVDFRELVRDLAQHFHVRIDMRQIGARDEAKELGGIAHCGEEFCCTRFGGEFHPVSIRMAKEQDLPLNPTKISGVCGRLMCCLRYEHEAYKDFKKRAPKKGTPVDTPLGEAVISGYNTPSEIMELKLSDGKRLNVPLAEMECHKEGNACTRCSVSNETIERCATQSMLIALGALDQQLGDSLSSQEELDVAVSNEGGQSGRKRRRRSSSSSDGADAAKRTGGSQKQAQSSKGRSQGQGGQASGSKGQEGGRKRRNRNANANAAGGQSSQKRGAQKNQNKPAPDQQGSQKKKGAADATKPRPGQNSSGLRKRRSHSGASQGADNTAQSPQKTQKSPRQEQGGSRRENRDAAVSTSQSSQGKRQPRRRHEGSGQGAQSSRGEDTTRQDNNN